VKRSRRFPETTASVSVARQFVAESLSALEPEVAEMAALLVSELATNAVVHATNDFAVTVLYPTPAGRVRVEVVDGVPGKPMPLRPPPSAPMVGAFSSSPASPTSGGSQGPTPRSARPSGSSWRPPPPMSGTPSPGSSGAGDGARPSSPCVAARQSRRSPELLSPRPRRYTKRMPAWSTPSHQS
jgi:hypothetical protein